MKQARASGGGAMKEPEYRLYEQPASEAMPQRLTLSALTTIFFCISAVVGLLALIIFAMERITQ